MHGGRQDCNLGDFWRYSIEHNEWEQLPCDYDAPDKLEGHSMVAHQGILYVFGGMIDSGSNQENTPLWMYHIESRTWYEGKAARDKETRPTNRKGHSAVLYQSNMYIYGGYFDLKGAVEEFWAFGFDTERWSALSPRTHGTGPGPRHGHSAVTHNSAMYLFGGLKHMAEQNDLWRFDFRKHNWSSMKTSSGPPKLVGHASLIHHGCLWIVGGGLPSRSPTSNVWRFHFSSRSWKKVSTGKENSQCAKMYHCVIGLSGESQPDLRISQQEIHHCVGYRGQREGGPSKDKSLRTWGKNKVSHISESDAIEMKTFKPFPSTPVFCSCTFSTNDQTDKQHLLSGCENDLFSSAGDVDTEESKDGQDTTQGDDQDFFLIIGGKPLSVPCGISVWQLKLG
ncbi:uncharacterized protein WCC33_013099 [Rhinophrynus dorsalis]